MNKPLALLALATAFLASAAPPPALAASDTIAITLTTQAATCSGGCSKTLNGPSGVNLAAKIVATYQVACNNTIPTGSTPSTCTAAQVVAYWVSTVGQKLQADILAYDQATAQVAANNAVTPVPVQ